MKRSGIHEKPCQFIAKVFSLGTYVCGCSNFGKVSLLTFCNGEVENRILLVEF
jgi:hypothetical protein